MLKWWLERDPLSITLASQPFSTLFTPFCHLHTQNLRPPKGIDVFPFLINLWLECGPLSWAFTSFSPYITPRGDPTCSTSPILAFGLIFDLGERSPRELCPLLCLSNENYVFLLIEALPLTLARIPHLSYGVLCNPNTPHSSLTPHHLSLIPSGAPSKRSAPFLF